jgi:hypothetical protein
MSIWGTVYDLERDKAIGNDPKSLRAEIDRLRAIEKAAKVFMQEQSEQNAERLNRLLGICGE